jgi:hypothetical protein
MIIAIWRIWAFMLWLGALIAVVAVLAAIALVLIVGAVVMGLTMPSRTVRGQLRSVDANVCELVSRIKSLGS